MADSRELERSLRWDGLETRRLFWAFGLSLLLHLFFFGTYKLGQQLHLAWPAWMRTAKSAAAMLEAKKQRQLDQEPPLVFIEVNPAAASAEAPKDAAFYSDKNSQAANPDAEAESNVPEIKGTQEVVPKTETVPREQISKLQPSRPIEQAAQAQEEAKPKPALAPGDLALAKPEDVRRPSEGDAEKGRPRTIKEALARKSANRIPGEEMKQDGGVKRIGIVPSFDTKATQFGAYDAAFIEAVSQRWFDLLDSRDYSFDRRGRVVLQFQLNHDGRITDMNVMENTVGEVLSLICQKAVLDPAPFERWSSDMRRMFGETRKIQFAFYYN